MKTQLCYKKFAAAWQGISSKLIFFVLGILSTIWFLLRVIPKPSRAAYPCIKTAAPFMSGFIIYLLTLSGSLFAFKKAWAKLLQSKYIAGGALIIVSIASISIFISTQTNDVLAKISDTQDITPNAPIGTGQGIIPGRVVWVHNKDATNESCTNSCGAAGTTADDDGWFLPQNNNQTVINTMTDDAIKSLAGEATVIDSWDAIFRYFNNKKHSTTTGYTAGEKIFIKINTTSASWLINYSDLSFDDVSSFNRSNYAIAETSPQTIYAILDQLVNDVGVNQADIYVGDPISHVWKQMYDYLSAAFPNVKYVDKYDYTSIGRTTLTSFPLTCMTYSDAGTVMSGAGTENYYSEMINADYLINIAALKAHERAGITLCSKNHFGSHTRSSAAHLHDGLIAPNSFPTRTNYGMYRVQVDIMGNDYLGGNTVLFFVDGLWGGPHDTKKPEKWFMAPFNNDWPNSIFISQDQVALESVCFDFLRNEFDGSNSYDPNSNYPLYGACDDYLEQAADPSKWPMGINYAPNGSNLTSLGVHEHWINATDKSYSRNLGGITGIELVSIPSNLVVIGDAYSVTFTVDDGSIPISGASVTFNYQTQITNASGQTVFSNVVTGNNKPYTISASGYANSYGTINVTQDVTEVAHLNVFVPGFYNVTFTVKNISNPIKDVYIEFNNTIKKTGTDGIVVFNNVSSAMNIPYSAEHNYYYTITGTVDVYGANVSSLILMWPTAIDESAKKQIIIYPNPVKDILTIENMINVSDISIISSTGQIYLKIENVNSNKLEIDLSSLSNAIYFLNIQLKDNRILCEKIVKY